MAKLNQLLENITQRAGVSDLKTSAERWNYTKQVSEDLSKLIFQLNQVYYPLVVGLSSEDNLNAIDYGLSGNVIFSDVQASLGSSAVYWDEGLGRAKTIKESFDTLLTEMNLISSNVLAASESEEYDDSLVLGLVDRNRLNLLQLKNDTMGATYSFGNDGVADLTYSLGRHIDAIGSFFTNFPTTGLTHTGSYPSISLTVNLSDINVDTTLPLSTITNLTDYLGYIRTFIGMSGVGPETPTYSTHGAISVVSDTWNLERSIQALDAAITAGVGTHAASHIYGAGDEIDGDKLGIDYTPSNYTPTTAPAEATSTNHLTAHLAGIDAAITAGSLSISGTDNALVRVDGTTALQESPIFVSDTGSLYPNVSGTKNLGASGSADTMWKSIFMDAATSITGIIFNGAGKISTNGDLTLNCSDLTILDSGSLWLNFDASDHALNFGGAAFASPAKITSTGGLDLDVATANTLDFTVGGVTRASFDPDLSELSLLTNGSKNPALSFGALSSTCYISGGVSERILVSADEEVRLQPGVGSYFDFYNDILTTPDSGGILLGPTVNAPYIFASQEELILRTYTGNGIFYLESGSSMEVTADTNFNLSAGTDIVFKMGSTSSDRIKFQADGFGTFAAFGDTNSNTYSLILAGDQTLTAAPSEGVRLYVESDTQAGDGEGLIEVENTQTFEGSTGISINHQYSATPDTQDYYLRFKGAGETLAFIAGDGAGSVVYNNFTGGHRGLKADLLDSRQYDRGMIVSASGAVGSDRYPKVTLAETRNDKKVMGIFIKELSTDDSDVYEPGQVEVRYAAIGDGFIWVSNVDGDIQNGDLITTSNIPGIGSLQDDDIFRNYTVAKCTQDINWDEVVEIEGVKKVMVSCTYHCG